MFFPRSTLEWFRFSVFVLIAAALLLYLGRTILNLQFKLLYYPGSSAPPAEILQANHLKLWQFSGGDYRGLVAVKEARPRNGTIVVFHGNGGTAVDRAHYLDAPGALGYRVILAEYPMYGGRKGELGEKAFVGDAKETIRIAFEEYGAPLYVLGESLGCGVAAAAAGQTSVQVDGVILITPWDTFASVAYSKFPSFPVRLFLRDRYDTIGNLASFKGNIAVVGAERDEVIPIGHAGNLYDSLSGSSRRWWMIQGAGHNDWVMHVDRNWWKEIMEFVSGGAQ